MESLWWLLALCKAWGGAATVLLTERQQRSSVELLWLRSLSALFLFSPCFVFEMPQNFLFYLFAFVVGFCVFLGDKIIFSSCQIYGALTVSRFMPLSVFGSFFLWLMVDTEQVKALIAKPLLATAILLSLSGAVWAVAVMRKGSDISKRAFFALLPTIVIFGLCDVFSTLAIQSQPPFIGALYFAFWVSVSTLFCSSVFLMLQKKMRPQVKFSFNIFVLLGFFHAVSTFGMMSAFYYAPNPGFVMALGLSIPIWVLMYRLMLKQKDDYANIAVGGVFLICATILVVLSSYL